MKSAEFFSLLGIVSNASVHPRVQARRLEMTCGEQFVPNPEAAAKSTNVMDNWIQATLQGLVQVRAGKRRSRVMQHAWLRAGYFAVRRLGVNLWTLWNRVR